MDGLFFLALSPGDSSSETLPPLNVRFTTAELSEREDLRRLGDSELIAQLLPVLQVSPNQAMPAAATPVSVSELSLLGQWGEVFHKAINHEDFLEWADRRQLDFTTLHVHGAVLQGRKHREPTLLSFTLADDSGWWKVANPIIYIAQLLDPLELGMPYIGDRVDNPARTLSLDRVLAFHGYPMPTNRLQAQVIAEELSAADAFPSIDGFGQSRSLIHGERLSQQADFQQLANALQAMAPFNGLALTHTHLQLTSGSWLARTMKEAAQHLLAVIHDNGEEAARAAAGDYHFDPVTRAIQVLPLLADGESYAYELRPENPGSRWHALVRLADKLGTRVYPDHSLSLAAGLKAYGIAHTTTHGGLTVLIARLHQWPMPPAPTLYTATRSLDERYFYSRFIGVLNDRHHLRDALYRAVNSGTLDGSLGLDAFVEIDAETLPPKLMPGRLQLRALVDQPALQAILVQHQVAPNGHVLLSVRNGLGAPGTDGTWKSLTAAVMANDQLAPQLLKLVTLAEKSGGELRTNEAISLRQALQLYNIPLPETLEAARLTARRRAITVPHALHESNYWRALLPAQAAQPSGWSLSQMDRQKLIRHNLNVVTEPERHLFNYLCDSLLEGKSLVDIRAEADLLLIRLIASPRAQQLASQLAQAVHWQGSEASVTGGHASRSALLWAALILSLDPNAGTHPTRINGLDWAAPYFWGESVAFVRLQIESSFRRLTPQAAVLAAHLMLCGQAPHLLVREIPDSLPFLCTQTWVLFQQCATYLEQRIPGSARQMSHDEILYLAYLPPRGSWAAFLESARATPPIIDWAVTNGLLPRQAHYTVAQTNTAIGALNSLRARLQSAEDIFAKPVPTRHGVALEALKEVYPQQTLLEDLVWEWSPIESGSAEDSSQAHTYAGKKYAFVDLYMANELVARSRRWVSSDSRIQYLQLSERFEQLQPFGLLFAQAFGAHLSQIQRAYVDCLQNTFAALSLPRREALEFGTVEFFALRSRTGPVGTFGLIMCVSFYSDRYVYECFPKYLLLRPRRDLDYATLLKAVQSASQVLPDLAFEWPAYSRGAEPTEHTPVTPWPGLRISKLDSVLLGVDTLPEADADGHRIPRSLDSPRSRAVATVITEHHYLSGGLALYVQAALVPTLAQLSRGDDPWADFLLSMALAAK